MISVIIPMYNAEKTINRCLDSVVDIPEVSEIIVIDDGSIDDSANIVMEYCERYSNVIYRYQKNRGVSAARNVGLELAKEEWIQFLDSDDWVNGILYRNMLTNLSTDSIGMICFGFEKVEEYGREMTNQRVESANIFTAKESRKKIFLDDGVGGYIGNKLFRREIIEKNKVCFDRTIRLCEDLMFVMEYLNYIDSVYFVSTPVYYYYYARLVRKERYSFATRKTALVAYRKLMEYKEVVEDEQLMRLVDNKYCSHCIRTARLAIRNNRDIPAAKDILKEIDVHRRKVFFNSDESLRLKIMYVILKTVPWLMVLV